MLHIIATNLRNVIKITVEIKYATSTQLRFYFYIVYRIYMYVTQCFECVYIHRTHSEPYGPFNSLCQIHSSAETCFTGSPILPRAHEHTHHTGIHTKRWRHIPHVIN